LNGASPTRVSVSTKRSSGWRSPTYWSSIAAITLGTCSAENDGPITLPTRVEAGSGPTSPPSVILIELGALLVDTQNPMLPTWWCPHELMQPDIVQRQITRSST